MFATASIEDNQLDYQEPSTVCRATLMTGSRAAPIAACAIDCNLLCIPKRRIRGMIHQAGWRETFVFLPGWPKLVHRSSRPAALILRHFVTLASNFKVKTSYFVPRDAAFGRPGLSFAKWGAYLQSIYLPNRVGETAEDRNGSSPETLSGSKVAGCDSPRMTFCMYRPLA
jgi:hypothetical protein